MKDIVAFSWILMGVVLIYIFIVNHIKNKKKEDEK